MCACVYIRIHIGVNCISGEPQTFGNLFKAIYWAMVSLTTVGYGDIYPVSDIGRIISMISSFLGIAVVALPSGIIISGYQEEIDKMNKSDL
jgi:voltage-gated potassium channel